MKLKYTSLVLLSVALVGCQSIDSLTGGQSVDYRSVSGGNPLQLPPDLSGAAINPQYVVGNAESEASRFLVQKNIRLKGDARSSWLEVNTKHSAQLWQRLEYFWESMGFAIKTRQPESGLMVTDWAENQAKIPTKKIPVIGSILGVFSDSSERDRFYTRVYRVGSDYRVVINHERLAEQAFKKDGTKVRWGHTAPNPAINAEMLSRLMVYLGGESEVAKEQLKARKTQLEAYVAPNSVQAAQIQQEMYETSPYLHLPLYAENTDYAWQWLGQVMTSAQFDIQKADYKTKSYEVLYLDTDDGLVHEEKGFFARLIGQKSNVTPQTYKLVAAQGDHGIEIHVEDMAGNILSSSTAKRILTVLGQAL
ncbi:MAG: outer membrane protein assembly factor BamC [Alcaligenaceae bacterium]|nr:outer membrane protein assembly factor BamC [Alcaligenaceae bacterium]